MDRRGNSRSDMGQRGHRSATGSKGQGRSDMGRLGHSRSDTGRRGRKNVRHGMERSGQGRRG